MSTPPRFSMASVVPLLLLAACGGDERGDTAAALGGIAGGKTYGGPVETCDGVDNNGNGRTDELCAQCDYLVTLPKPFWTRAYCVGQCSDRPGS